MNKTRQAVETVNFRLYFKVIIRQSLLVLFYSYFELQDDFILRILFLFISRKYIRQVCTLHEPIFFGQNVKVIYKFDLSTV